MIPIEARLAEAEAHRQRCNRPLVTLTYAQSLDGSLAARRGQPLALSGRESLELTHRLRAAHAAILVGIGTILADNPRLTVRLAPGESPRPVVLDSRLRLPPDAQVLQGMRKPWIATTGRGEAARRAALEAAGAELLTFPPDERGRVPLPDLLACLAARGVSSVMVEGGAEVIQAFLSQGLVDQVVLTIAPLFVGGLKAIDESNSLPGNLRLSEPGSTRLGEDIIVWGRLVG